MAPGRGSVCPGNQTTRQGDILTGQQHHTLHQPDPGLAQLITAQHVTSENPRREGGARWGIPNLPSFQACVPGSTQQPESFYRPCGCPPHPAFKGVSLASQLSDPPPLATHQTSLLPQGMEKCMEPQH